MCPLRQATRSRATSALGLYNVFAYDKPFADRPSSIGLFSDWFEGGTRRNGCFSIPHNEDRKHDQPDDDVAAYHERAERRDDRADPVRQMALREDEPRRAYIER